MKKLYTEVCGEVIELHHDINITKLNAELAVTKIGAPVIILQDWSKENKSKDLITLHLDDAMKLKAVFDSLIISATLLEREYVEELMEAPYKVD